MKVGRWGENRRAALGLAREVLVRCAQDGRAAAAVVVVGGGAGVG